MLLHRACYCAPLHVIYTAFLAIGTMRALRTTTTTTTTTEDTSCQRLDRAVSQRCLEYNYNWDMCDWGVRKAASKQMRLRSLTEGRQFSGVMNSWRWQTVPSRWKCETSKSQRPSITCEDARTAVHICTISRLTDRCYSNSKHVHFRLFAFLLIFQYVCDQLPKGWNSGTTGSTITTLAML